MKFTIAEAGEWVVNTQTIAEYPYPLSHSDKIEVMTSDESHDIGMASDWMYAWDTTGFFHITKYRKLN